MFAVRSTSALPQASIHTAGIHLHESAKPNCGVIRERGPPPTESHEPAMGGGVRSLYLVNQEDSMCRSSLAAIAAAASVAFVIACGQAPTSPAETSEFSPPAPSFDKGGGAQRCLWTHAVGGGGL